jgi:hypothetical protein
MYVCVFSLQIGGELPVFGAGGDIRQKSTVVAGGEESERSQCLFYNKSYVHWVKVVYRTTVCTQLTM